MYPQNQNLFHSFKDIFSFIHFQIFPIHIYTYTNFHWNQYFRIDANLFFCYYTSLHISNSNSSYVSIKSLWQHDAKTVTVPAINLERIAFLAVGIVTWRVVRSSSICINVGSTRIDDVHASLIEVLIRDVVSSRMNSRYAITRAHRCHRQTKLTRLVGHWLPEKKKERQY